MKKAVEEERGTGDVMEMSEDEGEDKVSEKAEEEEQMWDFISLLFIS